MYIKTSDQEKVNMGFGNYQCNWGLHIACLYETEQERDEIIFGYFNQGLKENDLILYCPAERSKEDFFKKYTEISSYYNEFLEYNINNSSIQEIINKYTEQVNEVTFSPKDIRVIYVGFKLLETMIKESSLLSLIEIEYNGLDEVTHFHLLDDIEDIEINKDKNSIKIGSCLYEYKEIEWV